MSWTLRNSAEAVGPGPFHNGTVGIFAWDGQAGASASYGAKATHPSATDFWGLIVAFGPTRPIFVQTAGSATTNSGLSSATATFGAANTAGNQLLLDVCWQANNVGLETITVTDSAGNAWEPACMIQRIGFSETYLQTWYCPNAAASGPVTVTVSEVGGGHVFQSVAIIISEYGNLGAPQPLPVWQASTGYGIGSTLTDPIGHTQAVTAVSGTFPYLSGSTRPSSWNDSGSVTGDGQLTWTDQGTGSNMVAAQKVSTDATDLDFALSCSNCFLHLVIGQQGGGATTPTAPSIGDPTGGTTPSVSPQPPADQPTQPFFANLSPPPLQTPIIDADSAQIGVPYQNRQDGVPSGDVVNAWAGWFSAVYQFLLSIGAAGGAGSLGVTVLTTSYSAGTPDTGRILALNSSAAHTLTLPSSPPNGTWNIFVQNIGTANWTIDPNGLNLNGAAGNLTLPPGYGFYLSTDGVSYYYEGFVGGSSGGGGAAIAVETIADLRALTAPTVDTAVVVEGYYAENDGGGGLFSWNAASSAADNGGTVISPASAPASGRWMRVYTGPIWARWFGAKGDGATSDTTAIQNAITAAAAGFLQVAFDGATYLCSQLTLATNGMLLTGQAGTVLKNNSAGHAILTVSANYCAIDLIEFNGNSGIGGTSATVLITGAHNRFFRCTSFSGTDQGFCFDGSSTTCNFNMCEACEAYSNAGIGFSTNTAPDNRFVNCWSYNNNLEGLTFDVSSHRCQAVGCRIDANCQTGGAGNIGVDGVNDCVISACIITSGHSVSGVKTQNNTGDTNRLVITGCSFQGNGAYGVDLFAGSGGNANNCTITGNEFQGNTSGPIRVSGADCTGNMIAGNALNGGSISDSGTSTIIIQNSTASIFTHSESLTDGASNFIFAGGDIVTVVGVPN